MEGHQLLHWTCFNASIFIYVQALVVKCINNQLFLNFSPSLSSTPFIPSFPAPAALSLAPGPC